MDERAGAIGLSRFPRHARAGHGLAVPSIDVYKIALYSDATLGVAPLRDARDGLEAPAPDESACVLLTPLGLLDLFRMPLAELTGARLRLSSFCASSWQHALCAALMRHASPRTFARWIEARLAELAPLSGAAARVARAATAIVEAQHTSLTVCELAHRSCITRRQLERDFQRWLGVSPKAYARRVRFVRAAAALAEGASILDAAIDHGFADQSHMTRVFGVLANATPREFARRWLPRTAATREARHHFR